VRSRENYDQLETFRQVGILVEEFSFTREHPAMERAAEFLFSFQTDEGDFRGIYGNQYATTYVGAIMELLVKAGYADDPRIAKGFLWLLATRQSDGGWAIPLRTVGVPFSEFVDLQRHPKPIAPDKAKPFSISSPGWCCGPSPPTRLIADPPRLDKQRNCWRPDSTRTMRMGQGRCQLLGTSLVSILVHRHCFGAR